MAQRFYDWKQTFPFLQETLLARRQEIIQELLMGHDGYHWTPWPEKNLYNTGGDWKTIPLLCTFPGNDETKKKWMNTDIFPNTITILKNIPGIRTALFSKLSPGTTLTLHRGWKQLSNFVLRCHLAIDLPQAISCGIMVDNEVRFITNEKCLLVFDDSKNHLAFNHDKENERVVLIVDIVRPLWVELGESDVSYTSELIKFEEEYLK